ncbi:MAG: CBS domain-containing protein [Thermodesulfobacteriota bacterium]|nr:CBS domain-containing protein [Thermodesulfobacteriota bacterium]
MAKVKDLMKRQVVTIGPDEPIKSAIKKMEAGGFRKIPVVEGSRLIGIITDRDLRQATSSPVIFHEVSYDEYLLTEINVGSCMTKNPITIRPDADIIEAARIVEDKKIGGLPVVDGDALVGIITISDLINYLIGTLEK